WHPSLEFLEIMEFVSTSRKFGRSRECGSSVWKRDTTSYMDLIYMDLLIARRLVNFPRVIMRHMSYVILVKDHELPYGDWLTMVFEEFGVPLVDKKGEESKRRVDDGIEAPEEEADEEVEAQNDFDWEAVIDEAADQGESGSGEKFYDAEDEIRELRRVVEEVRRWLLELDSARRRQR
ncbi:hypothetical protein Dimus_022541, partial [Dionaea muscipula]